jgi:hypothetical protein
LATPEKERGTLKPKGDGEEAQHLMVEETPNVQLFLASSRTFKNFECSLHRHHKSTYAPHYYSLTNNDNKKWIDFNLKTKFCFE